MPLSAGERLGPYEILAAIGAGGMGEVYKARDTRLDRVVAIKVSKDQFSERFHREARAVAALNHPNICHLYDIGPNYLVMEYVDGSPVRPNEDPQALLELAAQIAEGLAAAHHAGIVHRDLKPGNIFVTREARVKILDFGLALMAHSAAQAADATATMAITDPGTTVGTVAYMSPEQARGEPLDARSDLWSAGVVLYEAATRARPFEGGTTAVTFDAILNKAPIPVRERNPKVPPELARILERLLEKDRALRYQSAADLRADLKRVERDSASGHSVAAAVAAPGPARRTRMLTIAAAVLLAILGGGIFLWQRSEAKPLTDRDVLVLADFTNTTGDPVFDTTLRAALSIQLEQSPFLKIMSGDQMREALRFMDRSPSERITNDVAREICVRQAQKATIGGSIASLGAAYAITIEAVNCQNGESLAREQTQARDKEHVLEAVSEAAKTMRTRLGESLASVQKLEIPVTRVTTPSLEAFQAFAQGNERFRQGEFVAAIPLFQRATELDPNFAMAWWFLASSYQNAGLGGRGDYLDKAFELRERLSESERLSITTAYYAQRAGEWDKASDAAQSWIRTYPRVALPHFMLVGFRTFDGRPEEALREAQDAARLEPRNTIILAGVMGMFARMDRFDEANAVAQKASPTNWMPPTCTLTSFGLRTSRTTRLPRSARCAGLPEGRTNWRRLRRKHPMRWLWASGVSLKSCFGMPLTGRAAEVCRPALRPIRSTTCWWGTVPRRALPALPIMP
jgi:tetratricopeptide (TPR) repeat protein